MHTPVIVPVGGKDQDARQTLMIAYLTPVVVMANVR